MKGKNVTKRTIEHYRTNISKRYHCKSKRFRFLDSTEM